MSKPREKSKRKRSGKRSRRFAPMPPAESRAAEAITVAWTVSLTATLLCNLLAAGAHLFVKLLPNADRVQLLGNLLLASAALVGLVSLVLLPVVYRARRLPPPPGFVVFGVLISVAPILVVVGQLMVR